MFKKIALQWFTRKLAGYLGVAGAMSLDSHVLAIGAAVVTVGDLLLSLRKEIAQVKASAEK